MGGQTATVAQTAEAELLEEREGAVVVLTLNRPARMNALTWALGERLNRRLADLGSDPDVRAIVLTGAGKGFCSGADLKEDVGGAEPILREVYHPLLLTMLELPVPIVAALNGTAAGAGAALTFGSDFRVVAANARFQLSFTKIGLIPDVGSTWLLPRLVGHARAAEMSLLARDVQAAEALEWGLATRVCPEGEARAAGVALAQELAALSGSLGSAKAMLLRGWGDELRALLDAEAVEQGRIQQEPDFVEAIAAFRDRRAPSFGPRAVA